MEVNGGTGANYVATPSANKGSFRSGRSIQTKFVFDLGVFNTAESRVSVLFVQFA